MARFWKFALILVAVAVLCLWSGYVWRDKVIIENIDEIQNKGMASAREYEYLKIFRYDPNSDEEDFGVYVAIPSELQLKDKLSLFAERLSKFDFRGLPIELFSIDSISGRRIAIINLGEIDTANAPSWKYNFFQGSAGGGHTSKVLKSSFLQEEYSGQWVDGVEFYYEGRPIQGNKWDHIMLDGIKLRGQKTAK